MSTTVNRFALAVLAMVMIVSISGCAKPEPAGLTDDQVGKVANNILQAINMGDYQKFIQDFSDEMLAAFGQDQFNEIHDMLQESSGNYVSLGELTMINQKGYTIYLYQCEYGKESVIVKVVFAIGGDKVEGLYFDSTNLRAASK